MHYISFSLVAVFVAAVAVSMPAKSDEAAVSDNSMDVDTTAAVTALADKAEDERTDSEITDALGSEKDPQSEISRLAGDPAVAHAGDELNATSASRDKEEVWTEISEAISGLNDMVGDEMFRDLRRTEDNRMEVRVDVDYWQRVRYQTRVDLKNDISNIWHLYVMQYSDDVQSSVSFIDDQTNKTIDIFSRAK